MRSSKCNQLLRYQYLFFKKLNYNNDVFCTISAQLYTIIQKFFQKSRTNVKFQLMNKCHESFDEGLLGGIFEGIPKRYFYFKFLMNM